MRTLPLLKRNLTYYWRTYLAVVFGVAAAVSVLAGALLVGDSVRASLRGLLLEQLGNTNMVIASSSFFREELANDIQRNPQFTAAGFQAAAPLITLDGTITHEASGRFGSGIKVYGVDDRFWIFHTRRNHAPHNREILLSNDVARELNCRSGDALLLRVQKPSDIPIESLHSRKDELGRTLRLTMSEALTPEGMGEFSIEPQQGGTRAVFVAMRLLQRELGREGKVNLILLAKSPENQQESMTDKSDVQSLAAILKETTLLEDFGIELRKLDTQQAISLEHDSKLLNDSLAKTAVTAASRVSLQATKVLSYLANSISLSGRSVPYSVVTALDEESFSRLIPAAGQEKTEKQEPAPIILNEWAAQELDAKQGDPISLEYYLWQEDGGLETKRAAFQLAAVVPIAGIAADRDLVPDYPGITGSLHLADWDPPFPVDLGRIRPQDEEYWRQYRTTPKAFIPLPKGEALWQTRFGKTTSIRLTASPDVSLEQAMDSYRHELKELVSPAEMGLNIIAVREQGLQASRGATDFGEYFLYFSFFLVGSAVLLTALFFKLGIEQRLREIGLLAAVGFSKANIRKLFLLEGSIQAVAGSLIGLAGAVLYGYLMMKGLSTWWVNAVGTTMLRLHVEPLRLLLGALAGVLAAILCIVWTLRQVGRSSTRSLLAGNVAADNTKRLPDGIKRKKILTTFRLANLFVIVGLAFLIAASLERIGRVLGFFAGGTIVLIALLCYQASWLRRRRRDPIFSTDRWPILRLGFRNAGYHPGRSVLCIALIATAAFIIVSVGAFRRSSESQRDRKSGTGGFSLLASSAVPVVVDPNTVDGRETLNVETQDLSSLYFARFRVRSGDDASCLNLYQPRNPRIISPLDDFITTNRFAFQSSLAGSPEEKENPWLLLDRDFTDGAIPVIGDANSLTYVLHLNLGQELVLNGRTGPIRLRVVAALADSVFQSELLMGERNFLRLFPDQEGFRFFLIDTPAGANASQISATLEERLADFGFDVVNTSDRLASFHKVENTYLSTFQVLGGLGLVLGTLGLAAILIRNILEQRRELALLRAVGYNPTHFRKMVTAETVLLLGGGLLTGTICALLAIGPIFLERRNQLPKLSLGLLLLMVIVSGLVSSILATRAVLRSPLLPSLRAE